MTKVKINFYNCILLIYILMLRTAFAQEAIFTDTMERCTTATQFDVGLLQQVFSATGTFPDDPVLRSFLHCVFVGLGLQDPNGTIHYDLIRLEPHDIFSYVKHIDDPHDRLNKCESMHLQGSTPDETLFLAFKCFLD